MASMIALTNGRVVTPFREISHGTVVVQDGLIADFGPANQIRIPDGAEIIDVGGAYISPGFIDLHLHGAWGGDVMGASLEDLEKMSKGLARGGATSFLPTTLSGPLGEIARAACVIEEATKKDLGGAKVLGAHLEGPYFSMTQKGAQNPKYIIPPRPEDYLPILDRCPSIVRVSAAPEVPGGMELGQELRRRGIVAAIAHSDATYQEVVQAVENGYTHVTHIFSGMSGLRRISAYRVAGVIESALLLDELTVEMIADGHHLPPSLMKLVLKTKGIEKVNLVTDSMAAAGLGPGAYSLGGLDVVVEADIPSVFEIPTQSNNYVAKLTDRSSFASSVATMDQLVRNMVRFAGLSVPDAVRLVTANPARMQKIDHERGTIAKGMKADLAVFDADITVYMTMVEGRVVYKKDG